MPRAKRIILSSAFYHIIHKGTESDPLFRGPQDYHRFLNVLSKLPEKFDLEVHGFSLLENRYDLLVKTNAPNLPDAVRYLNQVYRQKLNWLDDGRGATNRNLFHSILIDSESYLGEVIRFIHRTAVEAGVADKPAFHFFSSHIDYLRPLACRDWVTKSAVLEKFENSPDTFDEYVNLGSSQEMKSVYSNPRLPVILGDERFVRRVQLIQLAAV